MSTKFGRRCQLSVEVNPDAKGVPQGNITFPPDLTIEFNIERRSLTSAQTAKFSILNLAEHTRNLVVKDQFALTEKRAVQFRAGYVDDAILPLCFNGEMRIAGSQRSTGATDIVTEIDAWSGGYAMANGFSAITIAAGATVRETITNLARSLPRIAGTPVVGDFPGTNLRGKVLFGNSWNLILQESGNFAIIDNNQVKVLQPNEAIAAEIPVISSASGLLGTPRRTQTSVEVDMLFEPRLTVGQIIELQSDSARIYNGVYKVMGFSHRGVISPAQGGKCTTTALLWFGNEEFRIVRSNLAQ